VHVVVVGCGRVGSGLATTLESEGHTVAVIDKRQQAFSRLPPGFQGRRIVGIGFDRTRLLEAGIDQAGAVAAVTNGDNSNIVVARVAREAFQVERVVARIYDSRRAAIYERLGIPTVATVQWATERVLRRILPDASGVEWIDPSARICVVERLAPTGWAGHALHELDVAGTARVMGLTRLGEATIPTEATILQEGDVLWAAVAGDRIEDYDRVLQAGPAKGGH
jgi:trk system potassium uptake protein TrkA